MSTAVIVVVTVIISVIITVINAFTLISTSRVNIIITETITLATLDGRNPEGQCSPPRPGIMIHPAVMTCNMSCIQHRV